MNANDEIATAASMLAPHYGKAFGSLVATGQAAIELALELSGIGANDEVIVPAEGCHLIPAAVVRRGATPVFSALDSDLTTSHDQVSPLVTKRTRAVVVVHHLGLPARVGEVRASLPEDVVVIEDAALAFGLRSGGDEVGSAADLVVTSFGEGKPLSLGGGGGVFGGDPSIAKAMRRYGADARSDVVVPRSYAIHRAAVSGLASAIEAAAALVAQRRAVVDRLRSALESDGFVVWAGFPGDEPTWHRLPIRASTPALFDLAVISSAWPGIGQLQHEQSMADLAMFAPWSTTSTPARPDPWMLLHTNAAEPVESWLSEVRARPVVGDLQ